MPVLILQLYPRFSPLWLSCQTSRILFCVRNNRVIKCIKQIYFTKVCTLHSDGDRVIKYLPGGVTLCCILWESERLNKLKSHFCSGYSFRLHILCLNLEYCHYWWYRYQIKYHRMVPKKYPRRTNRHLQLSLQSTPDVENSLFL